MHNVKMTENLLRKAQFAWETGYMLIVCQECPEHPRSMLLYTMAPCISVLQACPCPQKVMNLTDQLKHVSVLYALCTHTAAASAAPGCVTVPAPRPSRQCGKDGLWLCPCQPPAAASAGTPAGLCIAAYLRPGWESHPDPPNPSAVPPQQHCNTWKGLKLVLNATRLCKSEGCNAVQKQTENTAWVQPSQ